jgi:hypothetical protein
LSLHQAKLLEEGNAMNAIEDEIEKGSVDREPPHKQELTKASMS